jgi:hypothetical protein
MFSVGYTVTDDILEKHFKHSTSLFINQPTDTLDTTTTSQTTDGRLGNSLDIITKNLAMALGTSLSKTFSSLLDINSKGLIR